jgi:hypothetical protein
VWRFSIPDSSEPFDLGFWALYCPMTMRRKLILALVVLAAAIAIFVRESRRIDTPSEDPLRTINGAQVVYAQTHPGKGFASALAELGPAPGDELIDSVLASGRKSGHAFTLNAAQPEASGRITHYTLVARPETYGEGRPSFFTDETGVGHITVANRAAAVNDPLRRHD